MKTTEAARFVMLQINDTSHVVSLFGKRLLQPRDAGVLLALMAHTDTLTGRIHVTANHLAEELQCQPSEIRNAFARLKKHHLLRKVANKETGQWFYLLNPWMVQSGKPQAISLAMKQFQEA